MFKSLLLLNDNDHDLALNDALIKARTRSSRRGNSRRGSRDSKIVRRLYKTTNRGKLYATRILFGSKSRGRTSNRKRSKRPRNTGSGDSRTRSRRTPSVRRTIKTTGNARATRTRSSKRRRTLQDKGSLSRTLSTRRRRSRRRRKKRTSSRMSKMRRYTTLLGSRQAENSTISSRTTRRSNNSTITKSTRNRRKSRYTTSNDIIYDFQDGSAIRGTNTRLFENLKTILSNNMERSTYHATTSTKRSTSTNTSTNYSRRITSLTLRLLPKRTRAVSLVRNNILLRSSLKLCRLLNGACRFESNMRTSRSRRLLRTKLRIRTTRVMTSSTIRNKSTRNKRRSTRGNNYRALSRVLTNRQSSRQRKRSKRDTMLRYAGLSNRYDRVQYGSSRDSRAGGNTRRQRRGTNTRYLNALALTNRKHTIRNNSRQNKHAKSVRRSQKSRATKGATSMRDRRRNDNTTIARYGNRKRTSHGNRNDHRAKSNARSDTSRDTRNRRGSTWQITRGRKGAFRRRGLCLPSLGSSLRSTLQGQRLRTMLRRNMGTRNTRRYRSRKGTRLPILFMNRSVRLYGRRRRNKSRRTRQLSRNSMSRRRRRRLRSNTIVNPRTLNHVQYNLFFQYVTHYLFHLRRTRTTSSRRSTRSRRRRTPRLKRKQNIRRQYEGRLKSLSRYDASRMNGNGTARGSTTRRIILPLVMFFMFRGLFSLFLCGQLDIHLPWASKALLLPGPSDSTDPSRSNR